jgi:hypothetical protein
VLDRKPTTKLAVSNIDQFSCCGGMQEIKEQKHYRRQGHLQLLKMALAFGRAPHQVKLGPGVKQKQ